MLKPLFVASIVSLGLLAAACSSDDTGDDNAATPKDGPDGGTSGSTSSSGGPTGPAHEGCATKHKTFAVKPVDWFHVFKDEAEAVAYFRQLKATRTWRDAGSEAAKKGQAATTRAFEAYKKLYPEAVEGMTTAPVVMIEESPTTNAYAFVGANYPLKRTADTKAQSAYVFTYTSKYIDGATDDQLAYVAAHELGHLLLRNGQPEHFQDSYYVVASPEEAKKNVFGEYRTTSPDLDEAVAKVAQIGDRTGQCALAELNGLATTIGADTGDDDLAGARYFRYLHNLHKDLGLKGAKKADCTKAETLYSQALAIIYAHQKGAELDAIDVGDDAAKLDQTTKDYWTAEASCVSVITPMPTYRQTVAYAKQNYEDPTNWEALYTAAGKKLSNMDAYLGLSKLEQDADANQPTQNIALKIRDLGIKVHEVLRNVFALPSYQSIRWFTYEDESDEAAVRIGKILGIDPRVRVDKLLTTAGDEYSTACKATLASGAIPPFGGLVEVHHGTCWRAWRALTAADALKTCPSSWPE